MNEGFNNAGGVKIRNLPAASTFYTSNSVIPEDHLDTTKAYMNSEDLAVLFTKSDRKDPVGIIRTHEDANREAALKKRLINAERYKIGDTVRYSRDGHSEVATYEGIELEDMREAPKYKIVLHDSNREICTDKEFVSPVDVPDISDTNMSENQIKSLFQDLTAEEIQKLFSRNQHDELYTEFMAWHEKLGHLSKSNMFKMCENGELPSKFLALKDKTVICPSCVIGNMKRKPWRYKNGDSKIRQDKENFSGACVSVDQLVSKQPGLLPRQDGKHSLDIITGATVYHDNFTGYTYSHL